MPRRGAARPRLPLPEESVDKPRPYEPQGALVLTCPAIPFQKLPHRETFRRGGVFPTEILLFFPAVMACSVRLR